MNNSLRQQTSESPTISSRQQRATRVDALRMLFAVSLLWLVPTLACGSFAPRPTPTPTPPPSTPIVAQAPGTGNDSPDVATPLPQMPTDTPTPEAPPTEAPTPEPGTVLAVGQPARVTAPAGLNYREAPATNARLIGQFGTGILVTILEGPVDSDNFRWWRIDDGQGNSGWAAQGDGTTQWISPRLGDPQPANRPPRVGDRVQVTMPAGGQLSVRAAPGVNQQLLTRVNPGRQFTVLAGPQTTDGFTWYQIRSDDGSIEGWAADGDATTRWISPLE